VDSILGVPRLLDLEEEVASHAPHVVRIELGILVSRFGGGQLHAALALGGLLLVAGAPGSLRPGRLPGRQDLGHEQVQEPKADQHQQAEPVAEQRDVEQEAEDDVDGKALAVYPASAAATAAEVRRATARGGHRLGREPRQQHGHRREGDQ
jgi:hypothetical protein